MFTLAAHSRRGDDLAYSPDPILHRPPLRRIAKPWGEEVILARSDGAVRKLLRIHAGRRLSLQYHRRKRETLIVLRGQLLLTLGESLDALERRILRRGDRASIPPGTIHRLEALGGDAEVLELALDVAPDGDDVVRLQDDYGRAEDRAAPHRPRTL